MKIMRSIGRLFLILGGSLGLATLFNKAVIWDEYWNKTIFNVQTVDFNILFHTLPTKLSYNLINQNYEEVQKTLNSNYSGSTR